MSRQDLLELWTRRLDGAELGADESQRLHDGLERDAALREVVLEDWALDGLLHAGVQDPERGQRFTAGVATLIAADNDHGRFASQFQARLGKTGRWRVSRVRRRWGGLVTAAAAVLLVVLAWQWIPTRSTTAPISTPALADDLPQDVASGQRLAIGAILRPSAAQTLSWSDGTRAVLAQGGALTIGDPRAGKHLVLDAGSLRVDAATQPSNLPLRIHTAQADAIVVGTAFTLNADAERTRLTVDHGLVRLATSDRGEHAVGTGQAFIADRFGLRAPGQPVFAWDATSGGPTPVLGRVTTAPDGRPCVKAERDHDTVQVVAMSFDRAEGWCAYDPKSVVTCRVWLGTSVRWAGFYVQDYQHHHHGQWHVPLDQRNAWREVRFTLGELEGANSPAPTTGDVLHIIMLQAQFAPGAELYVDRITITSSDPVTP